MEWEFMVLNALQKGRTALWDRLMPCISFLGTWGILWIVITVLCLAVKQHRRLGISLAFNMGIDLIACNALLKPIVARLRPYVLNTTVSLLVPPETEFSFPSGHTLFAFGAATILFMYNKKVGTAVYVLAALIAFSRLYLYMHFPTDVFFGALFGVVLALISYYLDATLFPKSLKRAG